MTCLRTSGLERLKPTLVSSPSFLYSAAEIISSAELESVTRNGLYLQIGGATDISKPFRSVSAMFVTNGLAADTFDVLVHAVYQIGKNPDTAHYGVVPMVRIENIQASQNYTPNGVTDTTQIRVGEKLIDTFTELVGLNAAAVPAGLLDYTKKCFSGDDPIGVILGTGVKRFAVFGIPDLGNAQGVIFDVVTPVGVGLGVLAAANT